MKSCVLVGNGEFKHKYGNIIDSYDNVYRFNRFITNKYEEFVGTKCTHWVINQALVRDRDLFRKNIDDYMKLYPSLKKVLVLTSSTSIVDTLNNLKLNYEIFDYRILNFKILEIYKPSTGILTINFLLKKYDKIDLVGFDFGKTNHYWTQKNPSRADIPAGHKWDYEKKYVYDLIEIGKVNIINKK